MFGMNDETAACAETTEAVIAGAIKAQDVLGPGLFESIYKSCLAHELRKAGMRIETEVPLAVRYEDLELPNAYRMDMVVEGQVVLELKAIEKIAAVHQAQLQSYLRLSGYRVGLLLNFLAWPLKNGGIRRIVWRR